MVPLKYLRNFWRILEMHLINCKVNRILNWFENCVIVYANAGNQDATFALAKTEIYVTCDFITLG